MFKTLRTLEIETFLRRKTCSKTQKSGGFALYNLWITILKLIWINLFLYGFN